MGHWRVSSYSHSIFCDTGELILYNSFMGAIARIPADQSDFIKKLFAQDRIDDSDMDNPTLKELSIGGFLVPRDVPERDMVADVLNRERNSVFSIVILPHENCNFRCLYCYEEFERGKMEPDVITGLKALIDQKAREYKRISVSWFGGEPLLAPDVISELSEAFMAACRRAGIPYTSGITTNGYLLDADAIETLLAYEIRHFQITLDGPEAVHNQTRKRKGGGGTYQRIMTNLMAMRDSRADFRVKIRVNYGSGHLAEILVWLKEEIVPIFGGDHRFSMSFHSIGKWGGAADSRLEICESQAASDIRKTLNETSLALGLSDKSAKELLRPHGNVCYAAKESSIVVGADGALYKCTVAFADPRNHVGRLTKAGKLILDQARWNLWTKIDEELAQQCGPCSFYPPCQGRKCPLATMRTKQPSCPMTMSECEAMVRAVAFAARRQ